MEKFDPFETVLVMIGHGLMPLLLFGELLTQGLINLRKFNLKLIHQLGHALLQRWDDVGLERLSKLLLNQRVDGFLGHLSILVLL